MEYGLQLYSVRDLSERDFEGMLSSVAALGYRFVEFAGFFGRSAGEVRSLLQKNGLFVSGTHTSIDELSPLTIEATVAYHKELGNTNIIIPWMDFSTEEALNRGIEEICFAHEILRANGMTLGYHNHDEEFAITSYGKQPFAELEARTSVLFEIDTYWAHVAGEDPVKLLERLGSRVNVIHIKDGLLDHTAKALGEGIAPVKKVHAYAARHALPMVVESEGMDPTGIDEVARCMRYLKTMTGE